MTLTGVTVTGNTTEGHGAGIYQFGEGKLTLVGCTISGNTGTGAGTGYGYYYGASYGGGVFLSAGATFVMTESTVSGNSVTGSGGGLYISPSSTFQIERSTIDNNSAALGGGGGITITGFVSARISHSQQHHLRQQGGRRGRVRRRRNLPEVPVRN